MMDKLKFGDPNAKLKKMIKKVGLVLKTFTLPAGQRDGKSYRWAGHSVSLFHGKRRGAFPIIKKTRLA